MDLPGILAWIDYGYLVQDIDITDQDFASYPFICYLVTPEAIFFHQEEKKRYLKLSIQKERDKAFSFVYKIYNADTKDVSPLYLQEADFMIRRAVPDFAWMLKYLLAAYLIDMYVGQIEMFTLLTEEDKAEMDFDEIRGFEKSSEEARAKILLVKSFIFGTADFNDVLRNLALPL